MPTALGFAIQLFNLLPAIQQGVSGAIEAFTWGRDRLKTMADEDRDPTDEEWEELNERTRLLLEAINQD